MWTGDDTDELVGEALCLGLDGDEGAMFKKLALWFTKLGDRVRTEVERDAEGSAPARQQLEEQLLQLQGEIRALTDSEGAPLTWLPMDQLNGTPGGTLRLVAGTVEALNHLSRRAEFARSHHGRRA